MIGEKIVSTKKQRKKENILENLKKMINDRKKKKSNKTS